MHILVHISKNATFLSWFWNCSALLYPHHVTPIPLTYLGQWTCLPLSPWLLQQDVQKLVATLASDCCLWCHKAHSAAGTLFLAVATPHKIGLYIISAWSPLLPIINGYALSSEPYMGTTIFQKKIYTCISRLVPALQELHLTIFSK